MYHLNTGVQYHVSDDAIVDERAFGGIYSAYPSFQGFEESVEYMGLNVIRWPGGTYAERADHIYGFEYPGLVRQGVNRPNLTDMFEYSKETGMPLSVILPTIREGTNLTEVRSITREFITSVLSGDYGDIPDNLIFEIGNEYYAQTLYDGQPELYGAIANVMVTEIARALADQQLNTVDVGIDICLQLGRNPDDDIAIREQLSQFSLANIDMMARHSFPWRLESSDNGVEQTDAFIEAWSTAISEAGGDEPELFLSAFNTASFTRGEALDRFMRHADELDLSIDRDEIDLDGRTTTIFENYYQTGYIVDSGGISRYFHDALPAYDYGMAQASQLLELVSNWTEIGMDIGTFYGVDMQHNARLSDRAAGENNHFVGADIVRMMSESIVGLNVLETPGAYGAGERAADVNIHAFEGEGRVVVFLSANDIDGHVDFELDLSGVNGGVRALWVESLTGEVADDWMERFNIPDNPHVDESSEARTWEYGQRTNIIPEYLNGNLQLTFEEDYQIFRVVLATSSGSIPEINQWAGPGMVINGIDPSHPNTYLSAEDVSLWQISHQLENLILIGNGDINGHGNVRGNLIEGNAGDNMLNGGGGADTLYGGAGRDLLIGGLARDNLDGGADADILMGGLLIREDDLTTEIGAVYRTILGRDPSVTEIFAWEARRTNEEIGLDQMIDAFLASEEFANRSSGWSSSDFAPNFLSVLDDRSLNADEGFGQLNNPEFNEGVSRETIINIISDLTDSQPNVHEFTYEGLRSEYTDDLFRLYQSVFDRVPDVDGFEFWLDRMARGESFHDVVNLFVESREFDLRYGNISTSDFVEALYHNVLGRESDEGGFQNWTSLMNDQGWSRADVVLGFTQSIEFRQSTSDNLREWAREFWADDVLTGGAGDILVGGAGSDNFLFDMEAEGNVTVVDFEAWDILTFTAHQFENAQDVTNAMVQVGDDIMISNGRMEVWLENTNLTEVHADQLVI